MVTVVMLGPGGLSYASKKTGLYTWQLGGALGKNPSFPQGVPRPPNVGVIIKPPSEGAIITRPDIWTGMIPPNEGQPVPTGNIGVPEGPPTVPKEKGKFIPNMLRVAVEEKWGHHYGYFDTLLANDLEERHVLYKGQMITIPARARRAKMVQATKWRRYFGSS